MAEIGALLPLRAFSQESFERGDRNERHASNLDSLERTLCDEKIELGASNAGHATGLLDADRHALALLPLIAVGVFEMILTDDPAAIRLTIGSM